MAETIGFIGGTGPEGKGLAARFARAGMEVVIGSRSAERGEEAAQEVLAVSGGKLRGATNADAASAADIVVVTIPYSGQKDTLSALQAEIGSKIVVSTVVPLEFGKGRVTTQEIESKSAAEEAQLTVPNARVVGAFQNLSASHLIDVEHALDGDVFVAGDDKAAVKEIMELAATIKDLRGVDSGPLTSNRMIEGVTALLININRLHKAETHIRIVGI